VIVAACRASALVSSRYRRRLGEHHASSIEPEFFSPSRRVRCTNLRQMGARNISGPALSRSARLARRSGWTFMLGTCARDVRGSACLPIACPTVTSMQGSLMFTGGSLGMRVSANPWLICFHVGAARTQPRVFVVHWEHLVPDAGRFEVAENKPRRGAADRGVSVAPSTSVMEAVRGRDGPVEA
jgi:hypothetical protein